MCWIVAESSLTDESLKGLLKVTARQPMISIANGEACIDWKAVKALNLMQENVDVREDTDK